MIGSSPQLQPALPRKEKKGSLSAFMRDLSAAAADAADADAAESFEEEQGGNAIEKNLLA